MGDPQGTETLYQAAVAEETGQVCQTAANLPSKPALSLQGVEVANRGWLLKPGKGKDICS